MSYRKSMLIVYGGLPLGGIETFLVRLTRQFAQCNWDISVLLLTRRADDQLLNKLKLNANVVFLDEIKLTFAPIFKNGNAPINIAVPLNNKAILRLLGQSFDYIHAPDSISLLFASRLVSFYKTAKVFTGIYHDSEYAFDNICRLYFGRLLINSFATLPAENVICFNDHSAKLYSQRYNNPYVEKSTVVPIGVDLSMFKSYSGRKASNKIVSIGRLAVFKTYNKYTILAVRRLLDEGFNVSYNIYGSGEMESDLRSLVQSLGLVGYVKFKGTVDYSKFQEVVHDALTFVGSGTAIIEASACGVPSIIGLESNEGDETYGFLHQTTGLAYHSLNLAFPMTTIGERIKHLLTSSDEVYGKECLKARKRAEDFSLSKTVRGIAVAADKFTPIAKLHYYKVLFFVISLVFSFIFKRNVVRRYFFMRHLEQQSSP